MNKIASITSSSAKEMGFPQDCDLTKHNLEKTNVGMAHKWLKWRFH
jgi:hypothetical protein